MARRRAHLAVLLLFGAAAWVLYHQVLAYRILLQSRTPAAFFVFTGAFFHQWVDHPGGLLLYGGRFLRQFFHLPWAGALVPAILTTGLAAALLSVARRAGRHGLFAPLLPCVYLLIVHGASTTTLGILAAAASFAGYAALPGRRLKRVAACAALPLLYWLLGVFAWLFAAWAILFAMRETSGRSGRTLILPGIILLETLLIPVVAYRWLFPVSWHSAWLGPLPWPPALLDQALFAYLAVIPLGWSSLPFFPHLRQRLVRPRWDGALRAGVLVVVALALLVRAYDPRLARVARYDRLYRARRWNAILSLARSRPRTRDTAGVPEALMQFFVDHALCQTGKLLDEMFTYPQPWGSRGLVLDLPAYADNVRLAEYNSDLFFALGHINAAYRYAYNQRVLLGRTYANTSRLAECCLINGAGELTAKYLDILDHTLFYRGRARHLRHMLEDPRLAAEELAARRRLLPTVELDVGLCDLAALMALAHSEAPHHMAMEYLVAWCLLEKRALPLGVDEMLSLRRVGYTRLPVHCQEALLTWCAAGGASLAKARGLCTSDVVRRFDDFRQELHGPTAPAAAPTSSAARGAGSYMRYYAFSVTPSSHLGPGCFQRMADEFRSLGRTSVYADLHLQAELRSHGAGREGQRLPAGRSHQ